MAIYSRAFVMACLAVILSGGSVQGITIQSISAEEGHTLALDSEGSVWNWGFGTAYPIPTKVTNLLAIKAVFAGRYLNAAIDRSGDLWVWKVDTDASFDQMGFLARGLKGITSLMQSITHEAEKLQTHLSTTPHRLEGIDHVTSVAIGLDFLLVLRDDGSVWSWGENAFKQLGDGTTQDHWTPQPIAELKKITQVSANVHSAFAICSDGRVWAWGDQQLQYFPEPGTFDIPTPLITLSHVVKIDGHCALTQEGVTTCWDSNQSLHTPRHPPSGMTDIMDISGAMVLKQDGTIWTEGNNIYGHLGHGNEFKQGDRTHSHEPLQCVLAPNGMDCLTNIVAIADGKSYQVALSKDHKVWAWGDDRYGNLGDGQIGKGHERTIPIMVDFGFHPAYYARLAERKLFSLLFVVGMGWLGYWVVSRIFGRIKDLDGNSI